MIRVVSIFLLSIITVISSAQVSDFIVVKKKNGRIIRSFSPNSNITFQTFYNTYVSGPVMKIRNDSIYVKTFDIRTFMTNLGVTRTDTFNTFITPYHYKDIRSIKIYEKQRFVRSTTDKILMIGGAGYFLMNVINSIYLKQPLTDSKNLQKLGIAATIFATGFIINKFFYYNKNSVSKNKIEYINMNKRS